MFNIQFGGSNSAQLDIGWFMVEGQEQHLHISENDAKQTISFLKDVRSMGSADFESIIESITLLTV